MFKSLSGPARTALAFVLFAVTAVLFFLVFGNGVIDRSITEVFYSPDFDGFPLRRLWFVEVILYKGSKVFMTLVAFFLIWKAYQLIRRKTPGFTWWHLAAGFFGTILLLVGVDAAKRITGIQCPWSIDLYGGSMPYHTLVDELPACFRNSACRGRCFPAGHAMGGFYLFIWTAVFWNARRGLAVACLWAALGAGFLLGFIRMVQGAHFLSHVVASCWCAALFAYLIRLMLDAVEKRRLKSA